ncbi:MAG: hypothetical protein ABIG99_02065 [Patescibacteria group bacterium]
MKKSFCYSFFLSFFLVFFAGCAHMLAPQQGLEKGERLSLAIASVTFHSALVEAPNGNRVEVDVSSPIRSDKYAAVFVAATKKTLLEGFRVRGVIIDPDAITRLEVVIAESYRSLAVVRLMVGRITRDGETVEARTSRWTPDPARNAFDMDGWRNLSAAKTAAWFMGEDLINEILNSLRKKGEMRRKEK